MGDSSLDKPVICMQVHIFIGLYVNISSIHLCIQMYMGGRNFDQRAPYVLTIVTRGFDASRPRTQVGACVRGALPLWPETTQASGLTVVVFSGQYVVRHLGHLKIS